MSGRTSSMILLASIYPIGSHLGGWRHPDAYPEPAMNMSAIKDIARIAERGRFHSLFMADGNAVRQMDKPALFENAAPADRPAAFEPFTLMGALSQVTEHIGLVVTATTTYDEPYLMARRFASLDHLSSGRAVWNVVTGAFPGDSLNFGSEDLPSREVRYSRSIEFLEVCKGLWDSWASDAFPQDKGSGRFLDSTKVHTLHHVGDHFRVKGPLNVARSPQGYPVILMAGQSEPGREMAAKHADAIFTVALSKQESIAIYQDIKARMSKYGREPHELKVIPMLRANVAKTHDEALELYRYLNTLIAPELGVQYLSAELKHDLSAYPIDGPLPDLSSEVHGVTSIRAGIYSYAKERSLSIRETYQRMLVAEEEPPFTGTGEEVADQMQDWYESGACDGFNLSAPVLPMGLDNFVDLVIPELQRRGIFHDEYEEGTVRQQWGLRIPVNSNFQ